MAVTNKCEDYACQLLSACKTTHEVQILLQTRKRDAGKSQSFYTNIVRNTTNSSSTRIAYRKPHHISSLVDSTSLPAP